ncbi:Protein of unknown function [Chitinophaga eiseniae]|uniref:DUF1064 domain-containing protein n=1 Tax=Chitinophaga eiseniae TaxID=634771 RepID=A0A1T4SPJ5_9BACT|nr:Protein of unknown function [Chitinophaga eiseniae]
MKRKSKASITLKELKNSTVAGLNAEAIRELEEQEDAPKKSKYGNNRTEVDGIWFDSAKEAARYSTLRLMERAGLIRDLRRQVAFELNDGGTHSLKYIADFVYIDCTTSLQVVEDAKGFRTQEYLKRRRLMKNVHNIEIKEV